MASSIPILSEDQLLCSICLDVFTDPVSTPCGHNFCKSCLAGHWDKSYHCKCPLCNKIFENRPDLSVNTFISETAAHFIKTAEIKARRAHKHTPNLKKHTLIDPIENQEDYVSINWFMKNWRMILSLLPLLAFIFIFLMPGSMWTSVYAVDVTLDPDTAHPNLVLSDDGKQVRCGDKKQYLPDNPERFNKCVNVLGKKGFSSGRFYYEVQVNRKTDWELGVVRESINRKGQIKLNPQNGFWTVALRNGNEYYAGAGPSVLLSLRENLQKVGVFVDYEEGLVSFYDVEARSHIYSFTGQSFTEKLYPYFSPGLNEGGKNSAPLIISPVTRDD
uniref:Uncharacterized protein n=1 Tax=Astyanax mexicanus TaxID=7994 RepID=W5K8R9_ASTMX